MVQRLIIYNLIVLTFDAFTYFFMNEKYRGYLGINDYIRLFSNPMYRKSLLTKIFIVDFIVVLFFILFNWGKNQLNYIKYVLIYTKKWSTILILK